jgi:hypothetical protein
MTRRLIAAAVSVLLAATLLAGCRSGHAPSGAAALPDPRGLALAAGDLPGFGPTPGMRPAAAGLDDACPGGPHISDGTPPVPSRCEFTSFLADSAASGPGRAQIDATTRQGGNAVDPAAPMLPIAGPFVATHSGIFEIYDYVMILPSDAAAHDEFVVEARSRQAQDTDYRELAGSAGDERMMYRGVLGPAATTYETQIVTFWRRGNVVAMVNTMGAADVSEAEHVRLAGLIDARIAVR